MECSNIYISSCNQHEYHRRAAYFLSMAEDKQTLCIYDIWKLISREGVDLTRFGYKITRLVLEIGNIWKREKSDDSEM